MSYYSSLKGNKDMLYAHYDLMGKYARRFGPKIKPLDIKNNNDIQVYYNTNQFKFINSNGTFENPRNQYKLNDSTDGPFLVPSSEQIQYEQLSIPKRL